MNLFSSTQLVGVLEMLSEFLDMLPQLHTVGIEFTVLREKDLPIGLEIHLQCLLAEKIVENLGKILPKNVEKP